jgi:DNA-binding transcriptional LysR family regulator
MRMLNIHHVELFYYVARHGGISAALPHIPYGIQQPAVSLQIGRLEESLGLKLFERRPFILTRAGRELYEFAAPFFSGMDRVEASLRGDSEQHLRLAASPIVLQSHLPALLERLALRPPKLRLTLREANQTQAEALLRAQEVELAVVAMDAAATGFETERLLDLKAVLVLPIGDTAKTAAEVLRREGLCFIALPDGVQPSTAVFAELDRRGVPWKLAVEASSLELIDTYVAAGHGIGLSVEIPGVESAASVRRLPLTGFPAIEFGAIWSGRLGPLATRFLELVRERATELGGGEVVRRKRR